MWPYNPKLVPKLSPHCVTTPLYRLVTQGQESDTKTWASLLIFDSVITLVLQSVPPRSSVCLLHRAGGRDWGQESGTREQKVPIIPGPVPSSECSRLAEPGWKVVLGPLESERLDSSPTAAMDLLCDLENMSPPL